MTERTRQHLGGVVVALAMGIVGLVLHPASNLVGGLLIFSALTVAVVSLLGLAVDLTRPRA